MRGARGKDRWKQKGVSRTGLDRLTGSAHSDTLATDLSYTGVGGRRALQAPSAWLVPGYVAMCSTWPTASAQRPFVVARVAGWGLPLIRGQVFISKGRGRAKKERERGRGRKDKQRKEGGGGGKSTSAANYWKNIKVFSVCVKRKKRKEARGGRRRDRRLMAGLCVSWRIVARRGRS